MSLVLRLVEKVKNWIVMSVVAVDLVASCKIESPFDEWDDLYFYYHLP